MEPVPLPMLEYLGRCLTAQSGIPGSKGQSGLERSQRAIHFLHLHPDIQTFIPDRSTALPGSDITAGRDVGR
jgi:hypothetical protein